MSGPGEQHPRVVLVTGGARGLGRHLASAFARRGDQVVACGRTDPAGDQAGEFIRCDVREPDQVAELVETVTARFGRLDVLVNNAGGTPYADAGTMSPRLFERVVALNLLAPFYLAQRANAVMQGQPDGGSITNITSVSGMRPSPNTAAYGAAKAGLVNLVTSLAFEWGPKVRVNAVTAGLIRTELAHLFYGDEEAIARVAATVPLGRMGLPDDVASACLFLASPLAAYVSGANLVVHGGGEPPPYLDAVQSSG